MCGYLGIWLKVLDDIYSWISYLNGKRGAKMIAFLMIIEDAVERSKLEEIYKVHKQKLFILQEIFYMMSMKLKMLSRKLCLKYQNISMKILILSVTKHWGLLLL